MRKIQKGCQAHHRFIMKQRFEAMINQSDESFFCFFLAGPSPPSSAFLAGLGFGRGLGASFFFGGDGASSSTSMASSPSFFALGLGFGFGFFLASPSAGAFFFFLGGDASTSEDAFCLPLAFAEGFGLLFFFLAEESSLASELSSDPDPLEGEPSSLDEALKSSSEHMM
jgi:hypothetical protein